MNYCHNCGKPDVEWMKFCPQCGQGLAVSGVKEDQNYVLHSAMPVRKTSWFARHLNWTWFFAWISTPIAWYLVILALAFVADHWSPLDKLFELIMLLTWLVVYLAIMIPASIYVLRRKGRSFSWLLLIFSPVPFPMFLKDKLGRGLL